MTDLMEIERKFLLHEAPADLQQWPHTEISQGYLCCDQQHEVRLRRQGSRYLQTIKGAGDLARREIEVEIDQTLFTKMWPATEGRRVEKIRYQVAAGEHTLEVDVYLGRLAGLFTAEVEFESQAEAEAFAPPPWCAEEVTEDPRYKNKNLALHGLPQGPPG